MDWQLSLAEEILHGAEEDYVAELSALFTRSLIDGVNNPDLALNLARQNSEAALGIWAKYKNQVSDEVRASVEAAFAQQAAELQKTFEAAGKTITTNAITAAATENAIQSIKNMLNQSNVALADKQLELWRKTAAEAVARTELGADKDKVIESAVRKLTDGGLETISYTSGRNIPIDTALRTHIVAQANAGRARMLAADMEKYDWDIVFTSSHYGARPTHEPWQGRVFSYSGNSTEYPPLVENTGLGAPDGLLGINCRHEYYPYVEGYSQLPDRTFKQQQQYFGMSSDEYYEATQRQRTLERRVRTYKRRIAISKDEGRGFLADEAKLKRTQKELASWCKANKLTRDYAREKAYGVKRTPIQIREIKKRYPSIDTGRLRSVIHHADYDTPDINKLLKDLSFRDQKWLNGGKAPEITYSSKAVKLSNKKGGDLEKPWKKSHIRERETIDITRKRGWRSEFTQDYKLINNKRVGLYDLRCKLEIKKIDGNIRRITERMKEVNLKNGAKGAILDFSDNAILTSESILEEIRIRNSEIRIPYLVVILPGKTIKVIM